VGHQKRGGEEIAPMGGGFISLACVIPAGKIGTKGEKVKVGSNQVKDVNSCVVSGCSGDRAARWGVGCVDLGSFFSLQKM